MGNGWRTLRRRILTPDVSETSLEKRGFHRKSPAAQERLETIGEKFLLGYAHAVEARSVEQAEEWLEEIPTQFRGFAYEGAGMGYGVLDGLPFGKSSNTAEFLAGPGEKHDYIIYVGVGWAMCRLPRFAWPKASAFDPLLRWLVLDGYGFHQAYFKTEKYIRNQYQEPGFSWPDKRYDGYALRAIDQGIGRALWFICGTDVDLVTKTIEEFPESRHGDLYAGIGLASTYACGVTADELAELVDRAGIHHGPLAQGSAFAAECRVRSGLMIPETQMAAQAICGMSAERAAAITQEVRPAVVGGVDIDGDDVPAFETWRQRIAEEVLTHGGKNK
ncbi:DUF1702 family protein [Amycolatopsis tolypomycina]|uniref:Enediyne biosynthesis protein n=1 Tax=Amycolatopsis tolypomycina TaxID=208445 RepID=A0A1H4ZZK0_9PSEU|nr:DUF1702 family protein [Amycolatopsis tolypomycina]SED35573.1 Protein of unknown function [Amycolatopsis tolypomycina]